MGFSCDSEVSLTEVSPWWSTPRLMPIPSIVSSIISLVITSSFKDPGLLFTSRVQREEVVRDGEGEILIGSPSLTISIWFPRPILSRRVVPGEDGWALDPLGQLPMFG